MVHNFESSWVDDHVTVKWSLLNSDAEYTFEIFRRTNGQDAFIPITDAEITLSEDEFTFDDHSVEQATIYTYRIAVMEDGNTVTSFDTEVETPAPHLSLEQNHPNPFNPSTTIPFVIDKEGNVSLVIYDIAGTRVRTLVNRAMRPGSYKESWDGRNANGNAVASGVYFYRLTAGHRTLTMKALLLK
jgi:hypothetical protein